MYFSSDHTAEMDQGILLEKKQDWLPGYLLYILKILSHPALRSAGLSEAWEMKRCQAGMMLSRR